MVSDGVARSLGMPGGNAIGIGAPRPNLSCLAAAVKKVIPRTGPVEPRLSR